MPDMERHAFKMFLKPGQRNEYKRRHDEIWPELSSLLKSIGIQQYGIYLDASQNVLFAHLHIPNKLQLDSLPAQALMQRWWAYMQPLMLCNADNSPVVEVLEEVFYLE